MKKINECVLKHYTKILVLLVLFTILMLVTASLFFINDYISHPQFAIWDNFKDIINVISASSNKVWYVLFFVTDFIWAPFLLITIYGFILKLKKGKWLTGVTLKSEKCFLLVAILAYTVDAIENTMYLLLNGELATILKWIVRCKNVLYAIAFTFALYYLFLRYVYPNKKTIINFFKTSFVSLIVILVITVLISGVDQGPTIIVDLFDKRFFNVFGLFLLLSFFAVIISHFPIYLRLIFDSTFKGDLIMESKRPILGLGVVFLRPKQNGNKNDYKDKFLRRSLGILMYIAFLYVILKVVTLNYDLPESTPSLAFIVFFFFLWLFYQEQKKRYYRWKKVKYGNDDERDEAIAEIIKTVNLFPIYWMLSIILSFATAVSSKIFGWSKTTITLTILTLLVSTLAYIYLRVSRSDLKYVFFSTGLQKKNKRLFTKKTSKRILIAPLFNSVMAKRKGGIWLKFMNWLGRKTAYLSDNRNFLTVLQFIGIPCVLLVLAANIWPNYAIGHINALVVILLYITIYYSVIIILIKHVIFYKSNDLPKFYHSFKQGKQWINNYYNYRDIYRYIVPLLIILGLVWTNYSRGISMNLHEIQVAKKDVKKTTDIDTYVNNFIKLHKSETNNSTKQIPMYFVGSYGGGLKANLWNIILFQELQSKTKNDFFNHVFCLSGVSGGTIGISNYTMMSHEIDADDFPRIRKQIDTIGVSNILASDLTYLMGADFIREYLPYINWCGKDRSYFGMRKHAEMSGMKANDFGQLSYRDYWNKVYQKRIKNKLHYPAFIVNSTSIEGKQGVAMSLDVKENDNIFPGADHMLYNTTHEKELKDLSYYGTVSTTNRFPILSPAAKIKRKGHYVDGGYFENSGLLSAKGFFDYLMKTNKLKKITKDHYVLSNATDSIHVKPIFINIINSGDYYVKQWLDDKGVTRSAEDEVSEIASIIGTVGSTEKTPRYVAALIESEDLELRRIMMPHKITLDRVKSVMKGVPDEVIELMGDFKEHNVMLVDLLKAAKNNEKYYNYDHAKWGTVEPPLARMLSVPARQYQKVMAKDFDTIKNHINKIKLEVN